MNTVKCANDATPHLDFGHLAKMAMGSRRVATEMIAAWAQRNPSAQIEVQGYLDQREALNKYSWDGSGYIARSDALSDLRARLVRDALISAGVGSD